MTPKAFVTLAAITLVAVVGAVFARRRRIPIYPMLAFPAAIILSVAFTIGAVRYRAPAEILGLSAREWEVLEQ